MSLTNSRLYFSNRQRFYTVFFLLVCFCLFAPFAWADRNSSALNNLATDDFLDKMKEKYEQKNESISQNSELRSTWFSKDPADLAPLLGTTWKFDCKYIYGTNVCKDYTIRFGSSVRTTSDGSVGLDCINQHGDYGAVFYTEFPSGLGGGRGFSALFDFEEEFCLLRFYFFKVSGNSASGYHVHRLCGLTSNGHPITGYKVSGPTTTTTTSTTTTSTTSTTTTTLPTVPTAPDLSVTTKGPNIELSWSTVANANGYTLAYAPHPYTGPETIGNADMGNQTSASFELWKNAAFYVAMQAYNGAGASVFSNIELFILESSIWVEPSTATTQVDETATCTINGGNGVYSAASSDKSIAVVSVDGATLHVTGISEGNASIDVSDNAGDLATVSVTVGGSTFPTYTNSLGMTFILLPAGTFSMGSPGDEPERNSDETQHQVTLSQAFYMQQTEVTQAQWEAVMGSNPSKFAGCPTCPVENVSNDDIQEYVALINLRGEGTYSLPTEAQWEYAARAGSTTAFYNGGLTNWKCLYDPSLDIIGWYCYNSGDETHPVAQKTPNGWGLYDMSGNVWELCYDEYGTYPSGAVTDPMGPPDSCQVRRGGSWKASPGYCRSAYRNCTFLGGAGGTIGFRLTRQP
jgi:formylglycine-generating enzyme required for sulfatase activity